MEVALRVFDLINKEHESQPFTVLKQRILNEFELTNSEKLNRKFKLGDRNRRPY